MIGEAAERIEGAQISQVEVNIFAPDRTAFALLLEFVINGAARNRDRQETQLPHSVLENG